MLTIDLDRAHIAAGDRVLDVGCGGGRHTFACLKVGADVVALDMAKDELSGVAGMVGAMREAAEIDGARSLVLVGDATSLPLLCESFDAIIVAEILEHLVDDERAIAEVVRVLRPGGRVAVSVPRAGPERVNWALSSAYHAVEGGHVRIYRRRALIALFERSGLRFVGSHHVHGLHAPYWWLRCAVGIERDSQRLVVLYHRFLVWDIVRRPWLTRLLDAVLNPLIGKSLVIYLEKPAR